jgi:hypothetical protein
VRETEFALRAFVWPGRSGGVLVVQLLDGIQLADACLRSFLHSSRAGLDYLTFLGSGLVCMSALTFAILELVHAKYGERFWDQVNAPAWC